MGTTTTSGWAVFWFTLGFTTLGTAPIGGGIFSLLAGGAMIIYSGVLFKSARTKEEA